MLYWKLLKKQACRCACFAMFVGRFSGWNIILLGEIKLNDNILRMIAEFRTEQIHAAYVFCIGMNADAKRKEIALMQIQLIDGHIGNLFFVQHGARFVDTPCFQKTEMGGVDSP